VPSICKWCSHFGRAARNSCIDDLHIVTVSTSGNTLISGSTGQCINLVIR
jgi:hypothetical protein